MVQRRKNRWRGTRRRTSNRQKGGLLPLAALVPAFIAGGKAIGLGALGGGASFGAKKALEAVTRKSRKKTTKIKRPHALTPKQLQFLRKTGPIFGRAVGSAEKIRKNVLGIS